MGFKEIQMKPPEQNQSWQFRKISWGLTVCLSNR